MFQDSVPAGSYNDPFLSSVCVWVVCVCVCVCVSVCVCGGHVCTLKLHLDIIHLNAGGHWGPAGSVTNEDTSPGPV